MYPAGKPGRPPAPGQEPAGGQVPGPREPSWLDAGSNGIGNGPSSLVRPYTVTGGRTKPRYQLQIEAMVAASHYEARDLSVLSPECQAILGFCRDWRSVAEISAVLRMPRKSGCAVTFLGGPCVATFQMSVPRSPAPCKNRISGQCCPGFAS